MSEDTPTPIPEDTDAMPVDTTPPLSPDEASDTPVDPEPAPELTPTQKPIVDAKGEPVVDEDGNPIVDHPEDYVRFSLPRGPNPNILETKAVFRDYRGKEKAGDEGGMHISAVPCDGTTFESLIEAFPSINYSLGEESRGWSLEITNASKLLPRGKIFTEALSRSGSHWSQRVPYGASSIGPMRAVPDKNGGPGVKLSGEQAINRIVQHMGLGSSTTVPLWHSGFWAVLRCPTLSARLELQRRIDERKIYLGRITTGLVFSNVSVYVKNFLIDFALAHVISANVRYADAQELKDFILATDIPTLIWGILSTMYPTGYPYHQPCVNDPSKCQHVVEEMIDLNKILFVDTQSLTETQLRHMNERTKRYEMKDLLAYRDQHRYVKDGVFDLEGQKGSVKVELKVPTLSEYIASGLAWVDGTEQAIERAFGTDLQGQDRNRYILERARVTGMCEYSHWVRKVVLPTGEEADDVDTIRTLLATISSDTDISKAFFKAVASYIDASSIAVVALPKFDCPVCGTPSSSEESKYPYLNPIDVESLFFILGGQQIERAIQ